MRILLKNGAVVNVFTGEIEKTNILIEDKVIAGVGTEYCEADADKTEDLAGKFVCPGFIDGHIHIESTMLLPGELAKVCVPHGTTSIVSDPHEIANVCGTAGIEYMLETSEEIPMTVYLMLPSCVPATSFDESGAVLSAKDLKPFYNEVKVLGLAEMMNYPGVICGDGVVLEKINDAKEFNLIVNGHAPLLTGKSLDRYIAAGINDDHECSGFEEAAERIRKGQWVMIRQGTAARNLDALLPLFEEPYAHRCVLVTDDKHPSDLLESGHIDSIIRRAVKCGKSVVTGIRMATIQAAQCMGIRNLGAIAPGYIADILVLDDLDTVRVRDVYKNGEKVVENGIVCPFPEPEVRADLIKAVKNSFFMDELSAKNFYIEPKTPRCRVIKGIDDQLITDEWITEINWEKNGGIDIDRDILKIAVAERHMHTGHIGLGFISGIGLKEGAIASSVSHDSHNLVIVGTNDLDMATAANRIRELGGGCVVVRDGKVMAEMPLPVAGLMSEGSAETVAKENARVRKAVYKLGANKGLEPFMTMAFMSLSVIPSLKITTKGLVDVNSQKLVSLYVE
ncbi:MAG: adenine deaminase [Ruminococcaceae bacterium]|nr:adenine deaminase [Oscillospiraceae bacterium]